MGEACSTHGGNENVYNTLYGNTERKRLVGRPSIERRIILKSSEK
jgi:hypothetical protein